MSKMTHREIGTGSDTANTGNTAVGEWDHLRECLRRTLPARRKLAGVFVRQCLRPTEKAAARTAWVKVVAEVVLGAMSGRGHVWIPQTFIEDALRDAGYHLKRGRHGRLSVCAELDDDRPEARRFWKYGGHYPRGEQ